VFGEEGEHAGADVREGGEAGGEVSFSEVGEAELVHVSG